MIISQQNKTRPSIAGVFIEHHSKVSKPNREFTWENKYCEIDAFLKYDCRVS